MLNRDQISGVEKARQQTEQVAREVSWIELKAAPHQQGRAQGGKPKCNALRSRRQGARDPQSPGNEGEGRDIAEQGRIAELGHVNPDVPGGEIGGEKECREGRDRGQALARPMDGLAGQCSDREKKRKRERQPPEAGGDRTSPGQSNEPGTKCQCAAPDQDCGEGERMVARLIGWAAHVTAIGGSPRRRKSQAGGSSIS